MFLSFDGKNKAFHVSFETGPEILVASAIVIKLNRKRGKTVCSAFCIERCLLNKFTRRDFLMLCSCTYEPKAVFIEHRSSHNSVGFR